MFEENKYTRWYYQVISRAQTRDLPRGIYTERHHIIPKSLGGVNDKTNLVKLTAREHFIAHWLLTKMTQKLDQKKMVYAFKRMMHSQNQKQNRYKINSTLYEQLKNSMNRFLKNREFTDEWRAKLKKSAQRRAANEGQKEKEIRRNNLIQVNLRRKGEKRPKQSGANNHFFGVRMIGNNNPFFGKKHSEETLTKLRVPKEKIICPYCAAVVGGQSNFNRWHGDHCKALKEI